jgi:solute:Na+ symporter, SSS family
MQLNSLDWLIVFASLAVSMAPAVWFARRAGSSTAEFFTSGQAAPWWLVGTSMVATTFSTDTPNLVTDLVRRGGVAANWAWWSFLLTGMVTVFYYARLWRRAGVLTDLEFYELRYDGKPAAFVRGFRALYLGLLFNVVIMATVTLAAVKIANVLLGWDRTTTVLVCAAINIGFACMSGLWGVLASDLVQFCIAMVGVTAAAFIAVHRPEVGGLGGLVEKIDPRTLAILPDLHDPAAWVPLLLIPLTVQWWATWYPGSEPGGGSYVAQRMLAARDETHAMGATLWFQVAHYALRPWPWILVALSSLLVFPQLADVQRALPHVDPALIGHDIAYPAMLTFLPHGLLGLVVAALLAAYVSTMSTHLNWGASYLVHDFYRRFLRPGRTERHYVAVSRLVTAGLMVLAAGGVWLIGTAGQGFQLLLSIGAGTGLLYLLRWYWWRINAWSEIAAMASSFVIAVALQVAMRRGASVPPHWGLVGAVVVTTLVWVAATFATRPAREETLVRFVQRTRPAGPGWTRQRQAGGVAGSPDQPAFALLGCLLGVGLIYGALFATGQFLLGHPWIGAGLAVVAVGCGSGMVPLLRRLAR